MVNACTSNIYQTVQSRTNSEFAQNDWSQTFKLYQDREPTYTNNIATGFKSMVCLVTGINLCTDSMSAPRHMTNSCLLLNYTMEFFLY